MKVKKKHTYQPGELQFQQKVESASWNKNNQQESEGFVSLFLTLQKAEWIENNLDFPGNKRKLLSRPTCT